MLYVLCMYVCLYYNFNDIVNYTFRDEVLFEAMEVCMSLQFGKQDSLSRVMFQTLLLKKG